MNNNKVNLTALEARCKGVFSTNGYLYSWTDAKYVSPEEKLRDSYKGKQFLVGCEKTGRTPDTYFGLDNSKKHMYIGEGLPFVDRVRFQESQPEKPGKGFLTSDYNRRGEFTDTIRTEQYRSQLKQEEKINRKRQEKEPQLPVSELAPRETGPESFLFDRVYDQSRPGKEAQKLLRDTSNPTMLSKSRDVGTYNTTYLLQHRPPQPNEICRPEHARVALVRNTFYEKDMASANFVC